MNKINLNREPALIQKANKFINQNYVGRQNAVNHSLILLENYLAGMNNPNKPAGITLLLGPTGIGKTELVKKIAYPFLGFSDLYDPQDDAPIIKIDVGEFTKDTATTRLTGGDPNYVGYIDKSKKDSPDYAILSPNNIIKPYLNLLSKKLKTIDLVEELQRLENEKQILCNCTGKGADIPEKKRHKSDEKTLLGIIEKPRSVILFDEIEKAEPNSDILKILLNILDEGKLRMGNGDIAYFNNSLIYLTSNLNAETIQKILSGISSELGFGKEEYIRNNTQKEIQLTTQKKLEKFFAPELIGRIGLNNILILNPLSFEEIKMILDIKINNLNIKLAPKNISLELTEAAKNFILKLGYSKKYGARQLENTVTEKINSKIARMILLSQQDNIDWNFRKIIIDFDNNKNEIELYDCDSNNIYEKKFIQHSCYDSNLFSCSK